MELIITKSGCKHNKAKACIKSPKEAKKQNRSLSGNNIPVAFYNAHLAISELLFNCISFSEVLLLRSRRNNALVVIENCKSYNSGKKELSVVSVISENMGRHAVLCN